MTRLTTLTREDWRILAHEYATQRDARPDSWRALARHAGSYADAIRAQLTVTETATPEPYAGLADMSADVRHNRHFYVATGESVHPLWTQRENVNFRIWHDIAGHVAHDEPTSRHGEWRTFAATLPTVPTAARHALMCESIYQLAAAITLGDFPTLQRCTALGPYARLLMRTHTA